MADAGLVGCLVERLAARLPHRSGTSGQDLMQDEIVWSTRSTLVKISSTSINAVLDCLVSLLEDLVQSYQTTLAQPPHVVLSEYYVLGLMADCCRSHWQASSAGNHSTEVAKDGVSLSSTATKMGELPLPIQLDESAVSRIFNVLKVLYEPLPESYVLPATTILDLSWPMPSLTETPRDEDLGGSDEGLITLRLVESRMSEVDANVKAVVEYTTASNWSASFDYLRHLIFSVRTSASAQTVAAAPNGTAIVSGEEHAALVTLRLVSCYWVDGQKLGLIIQEFCSSFLHFRRPFQNTIAVVTPLLIMRWLERFPDEFVELHMTHKRLDGGADTLFDMAQTVMDNGRRRGVLLPLQIALLFLLPDVFEVAGSLREAKGSGAMAKRVSFLDNLRKALRNRNEQAAYCLTCLLRVARHFDAESDSALLSYAMDVQDEVRDAVFRRPVTSPDSAMADQDLTTAALVSLAHLNYDGTVDTLLKSCLSPSAPHLFKVSVMQTGSYFARLEEHPASLSKPSSSSMSIATSPSPSQRYRAMFVAAAPFIQDQLKSLSALFVDSSIGDTSAQRRLAESSNLFSITCSILAFLDTAPATLFDNPPADPSDRALFYQENFESFISCMLAGNEPVRRLAFGVARRVLADEHIIKTLRASRRLESKGFKNNFWRLTSLVLINMCDRPPSVSGEMQLQYIHDYLDSRLLVLSSVPELMEGTEEAPERVAAANKLETLLLVSLCSADLQTCQLVTSCIDLFLRECRSPTSLPSAPSGPPKTPSRTIGSGVPSPSPLSSTSQGKPSPQLVRNGEVLSEIASRAFRITGLAAFQKRTRGLLRRMRQPSSSILDAWEIAFDRWLYLSKDVSTLPVESLTEKSVAEWRNLSGFLASLGGICTANQASGADDAAAAGGYGGLSLAPGLRWIDSVTTDQHEEAPLNRYLRLSIQLLACGNVRIRETMREMLSTEVAPSLYQPLFKAIESELDVLFTGALESSLKGPDREIVFAEQCATLLRSLVERLDGPSDLGAAASVPLGTLTLSFAKFLDGVPDTIGSLKVKIKTCQLCEAVTRRKEHLNLRDDVRVRNQLLEYIFGWIARPRTPRVDVSSTISAVNVGGPMAAGGNAPTLGTATGTSATLTTTTTNTTTNTNTGATLVGAASTIGRSDEMGRVQRDLDRACLRSLAELTFRLPLQPGDGQNDAGTSELKSQMFHQYFNRFLSLLNLEAAESGRLDFSASAASREDTGIAPAAAATTTMVSGSDLAITILSNLLSANIDVGLKHSLSIGYHENVEIRTAFVRVLYNILLQGTEFSNLSDGAVNEKYDELLELLTGDSSLAVAMCAVCPSGEIDELTVSLLSIFETRGLTFVLIEALIKQEIDETENESELLRRTCVATKMLSIYGKWKGAAYLKNTLQKVVERLMLTSKDLDLELDPLRVTSPEELQKNALQLQIVAKVFIDDICASAVDIPPSFRRICSIISTAVMSRFPESKYTAVGAFIFLRFFCPAIVAPDAEGLVSSTPSKEMRRGLLLIAKVIQNLANNVLFGHKEPYMFPLNDFLTQNIYRVTSFLREISASPADGTTDEGLSRSRSGGAVVGESFDFGACVALHRYLYDHWDPVRQRLAALERRDYARSPAESLRGTRSPALQPLRNLIANLGPPPLAVTWNRPQISLNTPPAYSRFQNFMLRNAFRSSDSYVTARAVYDGGESKDGLSMICIILRNIDADSIDYDTLTFCYLKIASRLWHRPFGLLVDATCYNGQNEPQDELFHKLDQLTPTELSRQLSAIYVYNMNSAFRKCFRRILRVSSKKDTSVFNPKNVDYHLLGSLQDLQSHFHLSQLHLPKETISVVTDTRYVLQPITRLSKTKGKIEVVIKVGSQFVQVTTVKKQEVYPGFRLSTTVNDIFRLSDVDEAPTSIQTEDDSAFGLRADNGKIIMYFTSPKKTDILQAIRGAKAKYGKDGRALLKPFERLIRPQDVPGTLLNLALTNLASPDPVLRLSSYNLLGALCKAFKFDAAASRMLCTRDISVPLDPSRFIVSISALLARAEPQLTADFLNEFFVGWDSFSEEQRPLSLAYMAPWLPGLRSHLLASEADGDKTRDRISALFRKLIDVAMADPSLCFTLEQTVWPAILKDEVLLDIFLDEVMRIALAGGLHEDQMETLTSLIASMGSITLRGKIMSRLRKALNRSSLRPTRHLPDNAVWSELCILLQFCLSLSFDSGVQSQLFLPEIFHLVTMLVNTGTPDVRLIVHKLLVNTVHSACTSFRLDESTMARLRTNLEALTEPRSDVFPNPSLFPRDGAAAAAAAASSSLGPGHAHSHAHGDGHNPGPGLGPGAEVGAGGLGLVAIEHLATLLLEVCSVAAPSMDVANAWRSRWMSLVASTAFQNNPAIQPRAFTVMGCLAREEVDDDLLYQVLVALRNSVGRFGDDSNSEMLVAIVTSLSQMMAKLPSASRYGHQLFWLAMSLLRLLPQNLFNCAASFLESVLANISTSGDVKGDRMAPLLLQGRGQLEDAALPLDDVYGVHFGPDTFHFAACACLARGLTDTATRASALKLLCVLLEMSTWSSPASRRTGDMVNSPYLALILARTMYSDEARESLWAAGIDPATLSELVGSTDASIPGRPRAKDLGALRDKDLLLSTAIELVDFPYLEDAMQNRILQWLRELSTFRPAVVLHLCGPIIAALEHALLHCQNASTLESAHRLLETLTSQPKFAKALETTGNLNDLLEDMGFGGLWRSCSLNSAHDHDRQAFALTEKLIELIIV